ncbi:MAG TPA: sulfatase [Kofleriaceae bacterium]|nr:sulfatase [Kofleriaceae bacterium]
MRPTGILINASAAALLVSTLAMAPGCGDSDAASKPGTATHDPTTAKDKTPARRSVRTGLATWRALLAEAPRAELWDGGALIDLGTADAFKYTRGGWETGWGKTGKDGAVSFTEVVERAVELDVFAQAPVTELVMRARSAVKGQKVVAYVNGTALGNTDLGETWSTVRVPLGKTPVPAGRLDVTMSFRDAAGKGARAEVDWVWLRAADTAADTEPVILPRVLPVKVGATPERSLPAPSARTYSFYMEVPEAASLVFDYGADKATALSVSAQAEGEPEKQLFKATAEAGKWKEAKVDLGAYAGKAIRLDLSSTGKDAAFGWGEPEIMIPKSAAPKVAATSAARPKNVIFILMDTARADAYGPFNPKNEVETPTYDAFAKTATVFLNAHDDANWTKPSVTTQLTGLYPSTHDTKTDPAVLPDDITLLSQHLQAQGFHTAGFVANGFISKKFGFEKGWDTFKNYIRLGIPSDSEYVYADATDWLEKNAGNGRFFLYVQIIDPHVVYRAHKTTGLYYKGTYKGWLGPTIAADEQVAISDGKHAASDDDFAWIKAMYFGEVTYHDREMGKFFATLDKMGLRKDTLIVVTNDHGEELYDHKRLGHGHSLYEELIRSPMAISYPGLFPAGKEMSEVVETVDVSPTIVDALGVAPLKDVDGQSLLPLVQGQPSLRPYYAVSEFLGAQRSVRVSDYKLIVSSGNRVELYNVATDPKETADLQGKADIAQRLCEVYLGEGLASPNKAQRLQDMRVQRQFKSTKANIDPALKKQLEALGYFTE